MSNDTGETPLGPGDNPLLSGRCPAPFLDMKQFPKTGGYIPGRLCSEVAPGISCCLPCPATDWIYPQSFKTWYKSAQSVSAIGLAICVFLLLSWAVLPADKTRRHYLSVCLVIGIMLQALAFVIPLGAHPQQCHNNITPNDMRSNLACAFSGASIVLGGLVTTVWITFRALSMHVQICWNVVPGTKFFYSTMGVGWGVSVLFFVLTMAMAGVSYRFGDTCHVNAQHSMGQFWAPLLTLAGIAALLQFGTLLYCFKVYLANAWSDEQSETNHSAGLPSYTSSARAHSAKVVYRRVKKVLWLQWRSMTILVFLLVDIIFISVVWVGLDAAVNNFAGGHTEHIMPFLACILINPGINQRQKCFELGQKALVSEKTSIAILLLLALTGIQTGLLMIRSTFWGAWRDVFKRLFNRQKEFVSLDAKRFSTDPRIIHMNRIPTPNRVASANTAASGTDTFSSKEQGSPYFAQQHFDRNYRQPRMSFSTPRPVSANSPRPNWEAADSFVPVVPATPPPTRPPRDYDNRI